MASVAPYAIRSHRRTAFLGQTGHVERDPLPAGHRAMRRAAMNRAVSLLMPAGDGLSAALTWLALVETALLEMGGEPEGWRQMAGQHPERRDPLLSDARRLAGLLIQLRAQRQGRIDTLLTQAQTRPDDPWAQWTVLMLSGELEPATRERAAQLAALARAYRRAH